MEGANELGFFDGMDMIDWDHFLDDVPENLDLFDSIPATWEEFPATKTAAGDSFMGELEALLMRDDEQEQGGEIFDDANFQVSDILVDFPVEGQVVLDVSRPPSEAEVVDVGEEEKVSGLGSGSGSPSSSNSVGNEGVVVGDGSEKGRPNSGVDLESNGDNENDKSDDEYDDDEPSSKKRKRQLRNRDAAMRSRERKKMYVKDLEMKSQYLEAECRRLGRLLQCCYAENQMLRYSFHSSSALGAMTKPESAVLSLESLLLVSLVWFMANICLLLQPRLPLLNQGAVILVSMDRKDLESAALRRKGTKISDLWITRSFLRSKGCRASRTRMKSHFALNMCC